MIVLTAAYRLWKAGSLACEAFANGLTWLAQRCVAGVRFCDERARRVRFRLWERDFDARSKREGREP